MSASVGIPTARRAAHHGFPGTSCRRGRRTNGLLTWGLVGIDRRGGDATARWRIRTFAAARSRRVCARGTWCRKSAKNRYNARIISSSSFLTKPSYGEFPRGVLVGLIPKSGRESTEKSSNYDTTCVVNRPYFYFWPEFGYPSCTTRFPDTPPSEGRRARTSPAFLHHQGAAGVRSVIKLCIKKNEAIFVVLGVL